MNKQQYAFIKTSQETMQQIKEMTTKPQVTKAYTVCKSCKELSQGFMKNFGSCDPKWVPQNGSHYKVKPLTRKQFALIMSSKEMMTAIGEITEYVCTGHMTEAYKTTKKVNEIASKFVKDFGDCELYWKKTTAASTK